VNQLILAPIFSLGVYLSTPSQCFIFYHCHNVFFISATWHVISKLSVHSLNFPVMANALLFLIVFLLS